MQQEGFSPQSARATLFQQLPGFNGNAFSRSAGQLSQSQNLARCIDAYLYDRAGAWEPKTKLIYASNLRAFLAVLGNKPIRSITREECRTFKDTLLRLPPNMTKRFKGLGINQVLALNPEPMSAKNAQRTLIVVGGFFNWAAREGLVSGNPIKGIGIPLKIRADSERDAFSDDGLRLLFEKSPLYAGCRSERERHIPGTTVIRDAKSWLPLVGLYSGMRLAVAAKSQFSLRAFRAM